MNGGFEDLSREEKKVIYKIQDTLIHYMNLLVESKEATTYRYKEYESCSHILSNYGCCFYPCIKATYRKKDKQYRYILEIEGRTGKVCYNLKDDVLTGYLQKGRRTILRVNRKNIFYLSLKNNYIEVDYPFIEVFMKYLKEEIEKATYKVEEHRRYQIDRAKRKREQEQYEKDREEARINFLKEQFKFL
jgi:hypothetical protein